MKSTKAAGRYANSLLELSLEQSALEDVKNDMTVVRATIEANRELELMLKSPIIKTDAKQRVLSGVFGPNASELSLNFISLLAAKGREPMLFEICEAFIELYRAHKGIITAEVVSAVPLSDGARKALKETLSSSGSSIELTEKVDASLLGGVRVKVGDQLVDASLRRKLNEIKVDITKHKLSAI